MGSILSTLQSSILQQDRPVISSSLFLGTLAAITIIVLGSSSSYIKRILKRFIQIQIRKRFLDPYMRGSDKDEFVSYYRNTLCNFQKINYELLANILRSNHSCAFFVDQSISFLSSHRPSSASVTEQGYASIDEFREKVPLTKYDDYRSYIDRMIVDGAKNQLISDKTIYYVLSSGTTGKFKAIPMTKKIFKKYFELARSAPSVIWRSFPSSSFPAPEQRPFTLTTGRKPEQFPKSKNGTPMGPFSQCLSVVSPIPGIRLMASSYNVLSLDFIEGIPDFHANPFVQLVFALAIPNIFAYAVPFAAEFVHTMKLIENDFEEMSICIASASFDQSPLVRDKIHDRKFIATLNRALNETIIEYGGATYGLQRAEHVRRACLQRDVPGLLHRLWPSLIYASAAIGGSFTMYKQTIQFYCGERVPLINFNLYIATEGYFGTLASIHTDEYIPSPTTAFLEFIKEEDVHQAQPKTLLISEIEPGNRYELVCTTEAGLVRYRMGDIINCTRFLSRAEDLVPLPAEPIEIPHIPLISVGYRVGNLLDIFGEKTSEQNLIDALKQTVDNWKEQGIIVDICDFTCYPKLDAFPPHYIMFLELTDEQGYKISDQEFRILRNTVNATVEQQLCKLNFVYDRVRDAQYLDPIVCIFVRSGTFSIFLHEKLLTERASPVQIKPHRLLKNEDHIRFFYDNQIDTSSC